MSNALDQLHVMRCVTLRDVASSRSRTSCRSGSGSRKRLRWGKRSSSSIRYMLDIRVNRMSMKISPELARVNICRRWYTCTIQLDFTSPAGAFRLPPNLKALDILKEEPNALELKAPVKIVGDLHGQFFDLISMLDHCGAPCNGCRYLAPHTSHVQHREL